MEMVKRKVDDFVICDSIEWKGTNVTFRKALAVIPQDDITGSRIVRQWKAELEEITSPRVRIHFQVKTYGCIRKKASHRDPSSIKTWTHCWATFEVST
jgi:hypothetical protein